MITGGGIGDDAHRLDERVRQTPERAYDAGPRNRGMRPGTTRRASHPCTTDFSIMQWMPLEPLTVWVTRRSAARLQSV